MKPNMEKTIAPETHAMAELLGKLDAIFWPFVGNAEARCIGAAMELRRDWLSGKGLPCRGGGDANQRKAVERLWQRLESANLVTIARSHGRRTHAKFTTRGELLIRTLCATGDVATNWPFFTDVAALFDETGSASIPESFACGCEPWESTAEQGEMLTDQKLHLLPFITAGWLSCWHDCDGKQWIALKPEGRHAFTTGRPPRPPGEWGFNAAVADLYDSAFHRETKRLRNLTPTNQHAFWPPVSAGLGWGDFRKHLVLERELAEKRVQWERDAEAARNKRLAEFEGRPVERSEAASE